MATFGGRPLIDHDNLEGYADPVDYERQDSSDTGVAFYASLAQETGAPVLEIACATGRFAIPIARQGFAVTGLDVVPGMLELARSKAAGLPEHHGGLSQARLAARTSNRGRRATTGGAHANLGHPNLPAPAESRDALLRGQTGEQTGQESRSEGKEVQVDFCRRTE
jgi:SAM-dependent methyltransferase